MPGGHSIFYEENTVRDNSGTTRKSTDKNRIGEAGFLMPRDGYVRGTHYTDERQMLTRKKPERKKCKRKKRRAGISDLCVFRQKGDIFTEKQFPGSVSESMRWIYAKKSIFFMQTELSTILTRRILFTLLPFFMNCAILCINLCFIMYKTA